MLNCAIIGQGFRELEELLLAHDFAVEFSDVKKELEFNADVIFLLREPFESEIPAVSRLVKYKPVIAQPDAYVFYEKSKRREHWLNVHGAYLNEILWVESKEIMLSAAFMKGKPDYFVGVEYIAAINPYHLYSGWEVVLNCNKDCKAMLGDLAVRTGKDVILGQRRANLVVFSADILSDKALRLGDNGRFILNLLSDLLGGAEIIS
ncbi:MAG: hypothetical protein DRO98_05335 [Archaeoglobales archaeon]|nr:MAG: hypothetical protein DRO98_05335 [Archaeoglobales archaeon]